VTLCSTFALKVKHKLIVDWMLQEDCARTLLFRGADRSVKNRSGQMAHELAVNTGNLQLADVITRFAEHDVGKYCIVLYYNAPRR